MSTQTPEQQLIEFLNARIQVLEHYYNASVNTIKSLQEENNALKDQLKKQSNDKN